jgi:tRNA (cmo5U34)-methyltransferase
METFDFNKISNFDDHINKSIPNLGVLDDMICSISEYFLTPKSNIYDLGCSTGRLLDKINALNCQKIGLDNSQLLPQRSGFINTDLNGDFKIDNACLVYSVFTMQFILPQNRQRFLKTIWDGLNVGGALIICEKIYQNNGKIQEIMSFSHYDYKLKSFSAEEIIQKERDLRHIMKPSTADELLKMLSGVGFSIISDFWQMYNFKGIIAIK